jgi:hypothetical protein
MFVVAFGGAQANGRHQARFQPDAIAFDRWMGKQSVRPTGVSLSSLKEHGGRSRIPLRAKSCSSVEDVGARRFRCTPGSDMCFYEQVSARLLC